VRLGAARFACLAAAVSAAGCAQQQLPSTKTQLDALEVRDVEASPDRAFDAATQAIIDASYQIAVTDGEGGLITARRRVDPSIAEHVAVITLSTVLSLGRMPMDAHPTYYALCVQVLPRAGGLSSVRIRNYGPAGAAPDQETIRQIWTLMQRHVLIKEVIATPDAQKGG
jgi:hypothetical protein